MVYACVVSVVTHAMAHVWRSEVNLGCRSSPLHPPRWRRGPWLLSAAWASPQASGFFRLCLPSSCGRAGITGECVTVKGSGDTKSGTPTYKASVLPTDPSLHPNLKILILLPPPIKGWDYRNITVLVLLPWGLNLESRACWTNTLPNELHP